MGREIRHEPETMTEPNRNPRCTNRFERRRLLQVLGAAGTLGVAGCLGDDDATETGDDGSPEDGTETDDGSSDEDGIPWSTSLDGSNFWSPTVVEDTVFVGGQGLVAAIETGSGSVRWTEEFEMLMRNATVFDGTVYVQGNEGVFALDASDGSEQWSVELDFIGGIPGHTPTVYDGMVLAYSATSHIRAFDAEDGSDVWERNVGGANNGVSIVDDVYYTTSGEEAFALDPTDGSVIWERSVPAFLNRSVVGEGLLYGAGDGELFAYDLETGEEEWVYEQGDGMNFPTVHDGTLYVHESATGLIALEADSGEEKWIVEDDLHILGATPSVVGDTVFSTALDEMRVIDADTGEILDTHEPADANTIGSPIIVDGVLYATSDDTVLAFEVDVEGSSEDARIVTGVEGHHHTLVAERGG